MMNRLCAVLLALFLTLGIIAPLHAEQIPATALADVLDSWLKGHYSRYKFREWVSLGDAGKLTQRIAKRRLNVYVDPIQLEAVSPGANSGAFVPGNATHTDALYLAVHPRSESLTEANMLGLWHESIHVILSLDDNAVLESHNYTGMCREGDTYCYYVEQAIRELDTLGRYEDEFKKGDACSPEKLDFYWKRFESRIQAARENKGGGLCGVVNSPAQFAQMKALLGFEIDPAAIKAGYKNVHMDRCPTAAVVITVKEYEAAPDKPVKGADVKVKGEKSCFGKTDNAGKVLCSSFKDGVYELTVSAPGYRTYEATREFTAAQRSSYSTTIWLRPAPGFIGTVVDSRKVPLSGVQVRLKGKESYNTTTDIDGRFSFEGVTPGDYAVAATTTGYLHKQGEKVTVGGQNGLKSIQIVMQPIMSTITVRATSGKKPVGGAKVRIKDLAEQTTDSSGRASFKNVPPGAYKITAQAAGYAEGKQDLRVDPEKENEAALSIEIMLQAALSAKISVVDGATLKPVSDASVTMTGENGSEELSLPKGSGSLNGLSEGSYRIKAIASGYAPYTGSVALDASKENSLTIRMKAAAKVTVRVVGYDPVRKSEVRGLSNVYVRMDDAVEWLRGDRIVFEDVDSGSHTFHAVADGHNQGREAVQVGPGKSEYSATIRLASTKLATLGVSAYGSDKPNTLLRSGRSASLKGPKGNISPIYSAAGGTYFHNVPPGEYRLSFTAEGYEPYSASAVMGENEKHLEITLRAKPGKLDETKAAEASTESPQEVGNEPAKSVGGAIAGLFGALGKEIKKVADSVKEQPAQTEGKESGGLAGLANLFKKKEKKERDEGAQSSSPPPKAAEQQAQAPKPAEVKQPEKKPEPQVQAAKPAPPPPAQPVKSQQEIEFQKKQYESCYANEKSNYDFGLKERTRVGQADAPHFFRCGPMGTNWQMVPSSVCCDPFKRDSEKNLGAASTTLQSCGWDEELGKRKASLDKRMAECAAKYPQGK